ncbi:TSUP family transporter [Ramlibacter sp. XY19]|uniref:TSUP family transporter n=1 Tax=Ramlibacter paludis TaxID=2908000 RepID=UPI0023DAC80C|nr:TSUP family transporter [Ramlibacter paludis]MCG2593392.1 TSUP family transporter [Ramlibacter paludis]
MTAWQIAGFLACVAVASAAQGLTGFALALILLGLAGLFELAPLPDVANVATVLSLASAAVALRGPRKAVDWAALRSTALGTVVGVPAGVALLAWLDANVVMALRLLLGIVVIACALVVLRRAAPLVQRSSKASFAGIGVLAGLLGGLFSASGPPLVWQFYRQPIALDAVRDTLVATLAAGALLRLAMVVASGRFTARSLLLGALAVPLSMAITWWMRSHPPAWPRAAVLKLVCALLVVTGLGLVLPAAHALLNS